MAHDATLPQMGGLFPPTALRDELAQRGAVIGEWICTCSPARPPPVHRPDPLSPSALLSVPFPGPPPPQTTFHPHNLSCLIDGGYDASLYRTEHLSPHSRREFTRVWYMPLRLVAQGTKHRVAVTVRMTLRFTLIHSIPRGTRATTCTRLVTSLECGCHIWKLMVLSC